MGNILSAALTTWQGRIALSAVTIFSFYRLYHYVLAAARRSELKQRALRKRAERDFKREALQLPECKDPDAIVRLTATELMQKLNKGELTSEQVTLAFCHVALRVGRQLNSNAEERFEEALEEARERDRERKQGKIRGFLHGLPVSIKDQVDMVGFDSTCGCSARTFKPKTKDSLLVKMLRDQGAIPFVRTNVPQCLFLPESVNDIWGACKNPFNPNRTSGGSSGGEAVLLACRGSPLGVGTDIGGSIRGPAINCGVYGFKPTPSRISHQGLAVPRPDGVNGQNAVKSVAGPIARSVDDLELVMRAWCLETMWNTDPSVPPMPWNRDLYRPTENKKRLKFGYFTNDGYFDPAPVVERSVLDTVKALRKNGHEVVKLDFEFQKVALLYAILMSSEGGMQGFVEGLEGEALHPIYLFIYKTANMPLFLRPIIASFMSMLGKDRMANLVRHCKWRDTYSYWKAVGRRKLLRKKLIEKWQALGIDAVVCPAMGVPAVPHGMSDKLSQACSYTFIWNNLHFPAGVVPVTLTKSDEQHYESKMQDTITASAVRAAKDSAGLPMGVQVVALPWQDELCLRAMKAVEDAVHWKIPMPKY